MRQIALVFLTFSLVSCKEAKDSFYETSVLDCVETIVNHTGEETAEAVKSLKENSTEFKFARDLQEKISDRSTLKKAMTSVQSGKLNIAKRAIEDRIVQRGYSQELNQSLKVLETASQISEFEDKKDFLEINEAVREFYKIQIQAKSVFGDNSKLEAWLHKQKNDLQQEAISDKKNILRSLKFTADYTSLYNPEIFETLLLETAVVEQRYTLPGAEDNLDKKFSKAINSFGVTKLMKNLYSYNRNYSPATLLDKLNAAQTAAKAGNTALTLSSLEELQNIAPLPAPVRRDIIKSLFLAKGWNDASLINRDFMDISFILETVYKANEE